MSYPPPNVGPNPEWQRMEPLELLFSPVWGSLRGAHSGLLTNENKKALESRWYLKELSRKERKRNKIKPCNNIQGDTQDKVATH